MIKIEIQDANTAWEKEIYLDAISTAHTYILEVKAYDEEQHWARFAIFCRTGKFPV